LYSLQTSLTLGSFFTSFSDLAFLIVVYPFRVVSSDDLQPSTYNRYAGVASMGISKMMSFTQQAAAVRVWQT
jgi:hypothetical protein